MSIFEIFSLLFIDLLKFIMTYSAWYFGKQMVPGRHDPEEPFYTGWQQTGTYLRALFSCALAALFLGVSHNFKITSTTIEIFLLMTISSSIGIAEGYNHDKQKFKNLKRNDP